MVPFRGYTAWFSDSVEPNIIKQWGEHGGGYGPQATADYLFSESATSNDTILVYQETSIAVFHPEFITAILVEKTSLADIPIAKYLLLPPYTTTAQQIIATPSKHKTIKQLPKHKPVNNNNNNNKPTAVQSSKDSTHVRYYTSNDSIKDIVHIDSFGIITERLIPAAPNVNGLVVTRIP